ncbi:acyltransferase family protein [Butyrivibrio sp. VCB2006]|uniref:acyltransferase family protein n=1 Tax=Butyrivibrio sp. VCB2006 TaxID=1280679 RepID=UPI0003F82743|nr:acyltransferase [Butyrivibrio sp. VCB2006]
MNKEIVNAGRQKELDWAKAFAIIAMICVHVYEQISVVDTEVVPTGAFRLTLEFLAGPLAAPLFMFCMGIGIMYSKNSEPAQMVKRGFHLLKNGYLLSFFKGTVPTAIAIALGYVVPWTLADSFFLVSILQFAGMAFFTIALMKKMKFNLPAMMVTSLVLSVLGGQLSKLDFTGSWVQYLLGLFFETNDVTTFPLFRWIFYPVFGMIFGYFLLRTEDKNKFYLRIFPVGFVGALVFTFIYTALGFDIRTMFMLAGRVYYSQSLLHHLFIALVILTALPIYYFFSVKITAEPVNKAVSYLGKNLDVIYLAQWMIITYVQSILNIFGYVRIGIALIIPVGILVLLGSIGIIELIRLVKRKIGKKK